MGMNQTPASERVHISFFGKRNAGKSSVINAVTGQDLAIVSSVMGTTLSIISRSIKTFKYFGKFVAFISNAFDISLNCSQPEDIVLMIE